MARSVVERYGDLRLGLADASLVVLADRFKTKRIVTFDERAFRVGAPLSGGSFTVLPADSR
jgi:predicted nucleic acid-binding protein